MDLQIVECKSINKSKSRSRPCPSCPEKEKGNGNNNRRSWSYGRFRMARRPLSPSREDDEEEEGRERESSSSNKSVICDPYSTKSSGSKRISNRVDDVSSNSWGRGRGSCRGRGRGRGRGRRGLGSNGKHKDKVCYSWLAGNCPRSDDDCNFLHSFVLGGDVTFLTHLLGHQKAVRAISLPSNSDKLFSGSGDGTLRVWDCHTGQCGNVINLGGDVGCLLSDGPWLFAGLHNVVKAWNISTSIELSLDGPRGQVHALVGNSGMLLAGIQDGNILAWRLNSACDSFEPAASLTGHTLAVITLVSRVDRLYSGSMDQTIRVWDLGTFQCIQTLRGHTSVVMSLLFWDQFLLSCSLDKTIKVWVANSSGELEMTYTHNEDHGVLAMCGMHDEHAQPVLLCSCNDSIVHLYNLPSFYERGKLFLKNEVRTFQLGPNGLFFTGDGMGNLNVWKWAAQTS